MAKKMLIDATHAEETRVVVVDGNKVEEFDFEAQAKRQLAGNIYLAKVTRVEPSLQAAFVDYGGNRHGFLAFSEIHPDYYRIPIADREALIAEERAYAEAMRAEAEEEEKKPKKSRSRSRSRSRSKAADAATQDPTTSADPSGMETIDLGEDDADDSVDTPEGSSPMETVGETPVDTPAAGDSSEDVKPLGDYDDDAEEATAADRDDTIESVADDDDALDHRPVRKPRPKKYKIQEVIKTGQILLIQVVKEERGNKGAALTTYLSLAGRYCVLMPNTARGGGISRKITNAADRKKLKEIATSMEVPDGAGLIIRTAGSQRTKTEIKRDYEYLQRLWEQIRELTLKSIAPAPIYEEGNLIKRSIRDLYSKEIDEVIVEGEAGYRTAKDFMKMIMPSHAKNVKPYTEPMPLFARHQVESYLGGMFNPTVQLPSGGYIVIGVTEALVAIDVNSGRATKEGSIEQTALKTNLEAAEEVARQLRLRDLAGLIVIDFIDMDERKNNAAVEKRLKDKLKTDRARIQVGRISGFGLLEMSRQRLRPGMLEATTQPCPHCHGTGLLRSDDNVALGILRQIEEEGVRGKSREVLVRAPVGIANYLINHKREHIAGIEARYGLAVRIEGDPALVAPDYALEKFKTATRNVAEVVSPVISTDMGGYEDEDDYTEEDVVEAEAEEVHSAPPAPEAEETPSDKPKKRRRRRRRRKSGSGNGEGQETQSQDGQEVQEDAASGEDAPKDDAPAEAAAEVTAAAGADAETAGEEADKPKRKRTRSRSKKTADPETETAAPVEAAPDAEARPAQEPAAEADAEAEAPKPASRSRRRSSSKTKAKAEESAPVETPAAPAVAEETPAEPAVAEIEAPAEVSEPEAAPSGAAAPEPEAAPEAEPRPEPEHATADAAPEPAPQAEDKPKRRGWWNLGR